MKRDRQKENKQRGKNDLPVLNRNLIEKKNTPLKRRREKCHDGIEMHQRWQGNFWALNERTKKR